MSDNYFYEMLPKEELEQIEYIPTIPEFLSWIEVKWANRPALNDLNQKFTYAQMCSRIARRREWLNSQGLKKGDHIAILDRNSIDAIENFLAVTSNGMTAILLPSQLPAPAIAGCCVRFKLAALLAAADFKDRTEGVPCKVLPSDAMAESEAPSVSVGKDEAAAIFFTGGTTGAPKGAILPHRALMRGAFNGVFAPGSQLFGHRTIAFLPLSHVFGLIRGTLSALYVGAEWYAAEDMKATIGKIPVIRPTLLVLVPGLCDVVLGLAKMYGPKFLGGDLKTIISGAASVPPRLIREMDNLGIRCLPGYGMTEGANLTTGNADIDDRPDSVGKVYPEQEIKLVDGEIWYRGDNVFLGYYGDPENTAATLTEDGWVKTGDLGRIDEEGFVYITGRIKNLIILGNGENISPESIEEPFYKCDELKDCLVKEVEKDGEKVIGIEILPQQAAFEGKSDEEIESFFNELVRKINGTLPTTHRISSVRIRKEDFKRTGSLKVSRNQN